MTKKIYSLLAVIIILLASYPAYFFYETRQIGSTFQMASFQVIGMQRFPIVQWNYEYPDVVASVHKKSQRERVDFYFTTMVLGGEEMERSAEGILLMFESVDASDRPLLVTQLETFVKTKGFQNLSEDRKDATVNWLVTLKRFL